jgi:hypothetical protein
VLLTLSVADIAQAAVITIDGTVKSVDVKKRTITVQTKTKTLELDVSRKAKISVKSETAKLDSLAAGQKVKISYHDGLEIVLKIEAMSQSITLFNGKNLSGWTFVVPPAFKRRPGVDDCWSVDSKRGVLIARANGHNWLQTELLYQNFTLSFEWRFPFSGTVSPNGSGVVVRSTGSLKIDPKGVEIDLSKKYLGYFLGYVGPGSTLENRKNKAVGWPARFEWISKPKPKAKGEWNTTRIQCEGDKIRLWINNELVNDAWGAQTAKGRICLRSQDSAIEFQKIEIIELGK